MEKQTNMKWSLKGDGPLSSIPFGSRHCCSQEYHSSIVSRIKVMKIFEKVDLHNSQITTAVEFEVGLINLIPFILIKLHLQAPTTILSTCWTFYPHD